MWQERERVPLRPRLMASTCSLPLFPFHHRCPRGSSSPSSAPPSVSIRRSAGWSTEVDHTGRALQVQHAAGLTLGLSRFTLSQVQACGCQCSDGALWNAEAIWEHSDRHSVTIRAPETQGKAYKYTCIIIPPHAITWLSPPPSDHRLEPRPAPCSAVHVWNFVLVFPFTSYYQ